MGYITTLTQAGLLSSLVPAFFSWGSPNKMAEDHLHYRTLNGRSMKDLALKKAHHGKNRFLNPFGIPRKGRFRQLLYWKLFHDNSFESYLDNQPFRPLAVDWEGIRRRKGVSVTFLKHAGLLIKDEGTLIAVDPVFSEIFRFIKDFTPILNLEQMPDPDQVLITHGHYDHLDKDSLSRFDKNTAVITPLGYRSIFRNLGMKNHTFLDWYDVLPSPHRRITLLPCNHWTLRNPMDGPNRDLWGSYLIQTSGGPTIYISGDTAYFDGFSEIGSEYAIDLAVFNLGAYAPRWFMAPSHANPEEVVRAFKELNARKLMIVHWGTFRLGDEPVHFPPLDIRNALKKEGLLDKLVDIAHGETYALS